MIEFAPQVKVVADSISVFDKRLTTFQLRYWRGIHSELMTHRKFSRCAGSSRARPSQAIIDQVRSTPWGPPSWGENQPGMQADGEVDMMSVALATQSWKIAANNAADEAETLLNLRLHKQVVNRLLEPFTFIDVVVSSTEYNNWWALREDKDADPSIRLLAKSMHEAFDASTPKLLHVGDWHLPFVDIEKETVAAIDYLQKQNAAHHITSMEVMQVLQKVSAARCARTSYRNFDGTVAPIEDDAALFKKLVSSTLVHASPLEHQATPDAMIDNKWAHLNMHGNFTGWVQHRKLIRNEYVPG